MEKSATKVSSQNEHVPLTTAPTAIQACSTWSAGINTGFPRMHISTNGSDSGYARTHPHPHLHPHPHRHRHPHPHPHPHRHTYLYYLPLLSYVCK